MQRLTRLTALLGGFAAALLAGFALSNAVGHAATDPVTVDPSDFYTCDGSVCLVMGAADFNDWHYSGVRPFITNWEGDQAYHVMFNGTDGSSITAGSYDLKIEDSWSPLFALSEYHYGDFSPTAAAAGLDLGWFDDLSGASVYNASWFNGLVNQLSINDVGPHDASYFIISTADFSSTVVTVDGGSAAYIQLGDSDPMFLWNSLFHSGIAELQAPDYVLPADPFAGIDFDPSTFLWGDLADV